MNSLSAPRKVSYVISIWREAGQEAVFYWKGDLKTAAGQHLNFTSLAELNHLLCELCGWIDPPAESAPFIPSNDWDKEVSMVHTLILFPKSTDAQALDRFFSSANLLKQAHGFRSLKQSEGDIMSPMGPPPYSKVVEVTFDSHEDVFAFAQSAEAQAGKEDLKSLGGLMLIYDVNDV
jgi:uncharacterized protein (TIGR02118 family)